MKQHPFNRRTVALAGTLAAALVGASAAPALADDYTGQPADTSMCSDPQLSQPFAALGDDNWYALAPGQSSDNFDGSGWTLSGTASLTAAQLADGTTGSVLDLPAGAQAISPPMCVSVNYPTARTMVQSSDGGKVRVRVLSQSAGSEDRSRNAGQLGGQDASWSASNPLNLHTNKATGWQIVRFAFTAHGNHGDTQLYDFYVDPRMKA